MIQLLNLVINYLFRAVFCFILDVRNSAVQIVLKISLSLMNTYCLYLINFHAKSAGIAFRILSYSKKTVIDETLRG